MLISTCMWSLLPILSIQCDYLQLNLIDAAALAYSAGTTQKMMVESMSETMEARVNTRTSIRLWFLALLYIAYAGSGPVVAYFKQTYYNDVPWNQQPYAWPWNIVPYLIVTDIMALR